MFFLKKMGHCRPLFPLFSSFQYSLQLMFNINFCWWMDSNWGPPELEATTLPNNVFCFRLFGITMSSLFTNRTNDASSSTWDQCYKTFFCHNWLRLQSCWGHSPTGLTQSTKIWGSRTPRIKSTYVAGHLKYGPCGQSYKHITIVNYEATIVND